MNNLGSTLHNSFIRGIQESPRRGLDLQGTAIRWSRIVSTFCSRDTRACLHPNLSFKWSISKQWILLGPWSQGNRWCRPCAFHGVQIRRLNEHVKRNRKRFSEDFTFQLTPEEKAEVVAYCDPLEKLKFSKALPYSIYRAWFDYDSCRSKLTTSCWRERLYRQGVRATAWSYLRPSSITKHRMSVKTASYLARFKVNGSSIAAGSLHHSLTKRRPTAPSYRQISRRMRWRAMFGYLHIS